MMSPRKLLLHERFFLVFLLLLPIQLAYHFWPESAFIFGIRVDYLSPAVYLTDILFAFVLVGWVWSSVKKKPLSLSFVLVLFTYLLATSLLVAENQPAALYKLAKLLQFFLVGFYVARGFSLSVHDFRVKAVLGMSIIYSSLIGIAQVLLGKSTGLFWLLGERSFSLSAPGIATQSLGGQEILRAYSLFSHPNSFAGFLLVAGVLLLPWKTSPTRVAAVLGTGAFILTFSQGAWLAAVIVFVGTFLKIRKILPYLILITVITLSVFLLPSFLPQTEEVLLRRGLAETSLKMTTANPLFGVGLNNFIPRLPEFSQTPQISWWLQPVHNVFLLVLAETGLVGLGLFLWFLFLIFKKLEIGNARDSLSGKLEIAFLAILLTGSLDHYWLTLQQNQLLFTVVLGFIFSNNGLSQRS